MSELGHDTPADNVKSRTKEVEYLFLRVHLGNVAAVRTTTTISIDRHRRCRRQHTYIDNAADHSGD